MSASDKKIEKKLLEARKKLLDPLPSSVQELLQLLDKLFFCLSEVEQSPPHSIRNALSPLMRALVAARLFKHSNIDVKVAVAACICQITRITAPNAPYDDHQMKEVLQLIVASFEHLADFYSCSYAKRILILETVSDIRLCSVMLDLECDALFIEMFQHFLKAIRAHHPARIFLLMVTIMTLVLEESEDITPEMLSLILHYVKKDDKIPQVSQRLAEQVLINCASKLKKYMAEAVKSSGVSLDKYINVVASICEGAFCALKQNEVVAHKKKDHQGHLAREAAREDKQKATKLSTQEQTEAPRDEICKSRVSNGVAEIAPIGFSVDTDSSKKQDNMNAEDEPQQLDNPINSDLDKTIDEKTGVEHKTKKNGKQSSSVKQVDSSKDSVIKQEIEPPCDSSVNAVISSEKEKKTSVQDLPSKASADETTKVSSPFMAEGHHEEIRPVKDVNQKKKESSTKEAIPSATSVTKATSEAKFTKKSGEKVASSSKAKPAVPPSKKSTTEIKAAGSDNVQESSKPKDEKNKTGHEKAMDEESSHTSSGDNKKPAVSSGNSASKSKKQVNQPSEETPNTNTKRKRCLGKEKASDLQDYDENLIGSRVKVWWPCDRAYFKAVVNSYDSAKNNHLVCYDDGDQEILNLKKEKWYFVDESESSEDEEANQMGRDEEASIMKAPQKKKAKTGKEKSANKQSQMDISPEMLSPIPRYVKKDDEVPQVSQRFAVQVLSRCASQLKTYLTEAVKSSSGSIDNLGNVVDSICEGAFNALTQEEIVANEKEDKQKAAEVSTPEQTCVAKKRLNLEHSLVSLAHNSYVNATVSSINENGHEAVSMRRETVAEAGVKTQERRTCVAEEEDPAETETWTHKRARVKICSFHKANDEMEKTAAEGEPFSRTHKSSAEPRDLQCKKLTQPCSVSYQLARVKHSIVDTISSVRQFRTELEIKEESIVDTLSSVRQFQSEMKKKEDNLEASLQEIDVLGEKIMGINKILNS